MYAETPNLTRVSFALDQGPERPLPPPGHTFDGRMGEEGDALYAATAQVSTVALGGSTVTDDETTLVIRPYRSREGQPWADRLAPIEVTATTGATQTPAAVALLLEAALLAASTLTAIATLTSYQRVRDVVSWSANGSSLILTAASLDIDFTVEFSSTGSLTANTTTVVGKGGKMICGTFVEDGGLSPRGRRLAVPSANLSAKTLGLVMDGAGVAANDPGDHDHYYRQGGSGVRFAIWGAKTVRAEKAIAVAGSKVYRRIVAGAEPWQILGAATDAPEITAPQIVELTPDVQNNAIYKLALTVKDLLSGAVLATSEIQYTSDADATAGEIVTGLALALDTAAVTAHLTPSGTVTLILTMGLGKIIEIVDLGEAALAPVETQAAASSHALVPGATFLRKTSGPGSAPVDLPHPHA